ncbi:MAG: class I SAM-dependent methyltransferase [Lachnospiraceae bacterium]
MSEQLRRENTAYWNHRAASYSQVNQEELNGMQKLAWRQEIIAQIERAWPGRSPKSLRVLDVGTGPGFFAVILAEAGYQVTAVDAAEEMLQQAQENAGELAGRIQFHQMDAQRLTLQEGSFDVVLSRNLTWVLPQPEQAYASWTAVLKPGGLLLNFDANWYAYLYDSKKRTAYEQDRQNVQKQGYEDHYIGTDIDAMEKIALQVPLTGLHRPEWDVETLQQLEMTEIRTDERVWDRVLSPLEKTNYASTPVFMVTAMKPAVMPGDV